MKNKPCSLNHERAAGTSARPTEALTESDVTVHPDFAELPQDRRDLVEQMLVDGATFEDIVDTLNERGGDTTTLAAVQNFFRSNLEIQKRRVCHLVENAQQVKASLGNPATAEGQIAEAAFFTGFMGLHRRGAEVGLKDSERARLERENARLKQQLMVLRRNKVAQEAKVAAARARLLNTQYQLGKAKLGKLTHELETAPKGGRLGPETIQRIREIYGLICEAGLPQGENHAAPEA